MDALPSGTSLGGRYRLIDELGHGGMARVWRAFDDVLGRLVAVKLLSPSLTGDREFLDRFRVEARAAARLAHPNIASVFDYGEWDLPGGERMACIVMELLEGESLAARLRRGRLPWAEAVAAGAQVAQALAAAHRCGVVHRDVKPGNVVLTAAGAKVLDFGIAGMTGELAATSGGVMGTAQYVAPELLRGGELTPAADVYGLGVLLFESLTGTLPGQPGARLDGVGGLPVEVVAVVEYCLADQPGQRPSTEEVAEWLGQVLGTGTRQVAAWRSGREPASGADTALLLAPDLEDLLATPVRGAPRGRRWLPVVAVAGAFALALVVAVALRPDAPRPTTAGSASATTAAPATTVAGSLPTTESTVPLASPQGKGAPARAVRSLERVQRAIDDAVAAEEIRPDVANDFNNLIGGLRATIAAGQTTGLAQRVQEIQFKLDERLREPGAIDPDRAKRLADALGDLARTVDSM
jgi:eukaryotic-like serine/threonine-protein kinase